MPQEVCRLFCNSERTVSKLLKQAGYSLQANSKTIEGAQHPDRRVPERSVRGPVTLGFVTM